MKEAYPDNVIKKILKITLDNQPFCYLSIEPNGNLLEIGGKFAPPQLKQMTLGEQCLDALPCLDEFSRSDQTLDMIPMLDLGEEVIVDLHLFRDEELIWAIILDKSDQIAWEKKAKQETNKLRLLEQTLLNQIDSHSENVDLPSILDILVLLRNSNGSFKLLHSFPKPFETIYPEAKNSTKELNPQSKFPFLENFLVDAEDHWAQENYTKPLHSGPWVETLNKDEYALEAIAANSNEQEFLLIKLLSKEYHSHKHVLQVGRQGMLEKTQLEQEIRKRTALIRAREEEIALRLVCAADSRDDGETGSHIRRLGLYSELMAIELGWSQDKIDEIRIAAPMHDIGKIGVPDRILRKPGALTEEEYEIMKKHPIIGGQILSDSHSPLVNMAEEICLGHHERWDGTGYPFGLSGKQIPVSARIVALVDVFDALTHKRVYKDKIEVDEAIEIMKKGRGSHFDPELFDTFIGLKEQMQKISEEYRDPPIRTIDSIIS